MLRSSQLFIQLAMFDLEIKAVLRGRGGGEDREKQNIQSPTPLLIFHCCSPPWYQFLSLLICPLPSESKIVLIVVARKILSTRMPKFHLLCRLRKNQSHHYGEIGGLSNAHGVYLCQGEVNRIKRTCVQ